MNSNWAVFISGTGSNLVAFFESGQNVNLVVSSQPKAYGLSRARCRGIPTFLFQNNDWEGLHFELKRCLIDYIFLAGFMKIVPEHFIQKWQGQIFNIHPSLLPLYPGLKSIERSFHEKADMGCTLHEVITEVDAGKKIQQKKIKPARTLEACEFLVHIAEHATVRKGFQWVPKNT